MDAGISQGLIRPGALPLPETLARLDAPDAGRRKNLLRATVRIAEMKTEVIQFAATGCPPDFAGTGPS